MLYGGAPLAGGGMPGGCTTAGGAPCEMIAGSDAGAADAGLSHTCKSLMSEPRKIMYSYTMLQRNCRLFRVNRVQGALIPDFAFGD